MKASIPLLPIWGAIGMAVGAGIGVSQHDMPRWIGIGLALGVAFGGVVDIMRRRRDRGQ